MIPNFTHDIIGDAIRDAVAKRTQNVTKEITEKAIEQLRGSIAEIAASVSLQIAKYIRVETFQNEIVVRLQIIEKVTP